MTHRLTIPWPDERFFAERGGRPFRILAVSDEPDHALDERASRDAVGRVDLIVGAGDLEPSYLTFLTDAFGGAPLRYVRGNHDTGAAWHLAERRHLPDPLADGRLVHEQGLRIVGFSGSPEYSNDLRLQASSAEMWLRALFAWPRLAGRSPLLLLSHAPPRGLNDAADRTHRGFPAFRWLLERLRPPLWLHGHTSLVRRNIDSRCTRHGETLLYNCTGATLIELVPPPASES